jgi:hypothetical protein
LREKLKVLGQASFEAGKPEQIENENDGEKDCSEA